MSQPPRSPGRTSPRRIGPYLLEETLGAGGMGTVFRARHETTGAVHAVKLMRTSLAGPRLDRALARFRREVEVLARVDAHPGLVRVHSAGRGAGIPWIAMELVEGASLHARLRDGPIEPRAAARLVAKIARALAHVHARGVLHRDLKPENVLIDAATGEPRVTDFGLAFDVFDDALTRTGELLGTPAFMPPEQVSRDRNVDALGPASDVYGLGAVLYACLTGHPPFAGEGLELLHAVVARPPDPPSARAPGIPPALDSQCLHALAKRPADRPASAGAFADALDAWAETWSGSSGSETIRAVGWIRRAVADRPMTRLVLPLVALAVFATAGLAVYRSGVAEPDDPARSRLVALEADIAAGRLPDVATIEALSADPALADDPALAGRAELALLLVRAGRGEDVSARLTDLIVDLDGAGGRAVRRRAVRSLHAAGATAAAVPILTDAADLHGGDPRLRSDLARAVARGDASPPRDPSILGALIRTPELDDDERAHLVIASGEAALAEGPTGFDRAFDAFVRAFTEYHVRADPDAWPDAFVVRVVDEAARAIDPTIRGDIDADGWAAVELACRVYRGERLPPQERVREIVGAAVDMLLGARVSATGKNAARLILAARWGREVSDPIIWSASVEPSKLDALVDRELGKPARARRPDILLLLGLLYRGRSGVVVPSAVRAIEGAAASLDGVEDERWFHITLARLLAWIDRHDEALASAHRALEVDRRLPDGKRWPDLFPPVLQRIGRAPETRAERLRLIDEWVRVQEAVLETARIEGIEPLPSTLDRRDRLGFFLAAVLDHFVGRDEGCCTDGIDLGALIDRCVALETRYDELLLLCRAIHLADHGQVEVALERSGPLLERALRLHHDSDGEMVSASTLRRVITWRVRLLEARGRADEATAQRAALDELRRGRGRGR